MKRQYIIGSRGSQLALWQTNFVKATLERHFPDLRFEIKIIRTTGDKMLDVALAKIGDKGLFTKQIETALIRAEIDLAVHSLKDLQTVQPEDLCIAAVTRREPANDVLIAQKYGSIDRLPPGATVATGSLRRRSQLLYRRPDVQIVEIRGNVPTRLEKFAASDLDAMILAYAGVHRLGLDAHIAEIIPTELMLPAVGQGAMAIETRAADAELNEILRVLNDDATKTCVTAERAFLRTLEGGCQVPIGAHARLLDDEIHLEGFVGDLDGTVNWREKTNGAKENAKDLGENLAKALIEKGANRLLERTREKVEESIETVV